MKNFSKNNYSGKNRNQQESNSDSNFYSKKINSSKKNNRFSIKSSKKQGVHNPSENIKSKVFIAVSVLLKTLVLFKIS